MSTLKKIGRALIILIAVLAIVLSAAGIYGAWYANRTLTDVTLKVFTVVDTGVAIAQTGVDARRLAGSRWPDRGPAGRADD